MDRISPVLADHNTTNGNVSNLDDIQLTTNSAEDVNENKEPKLLDPQPIINHEKSKAKILQKLEMQQQSVTKKRLTQVREAEEERMQTESRGYEDSHTCSSKQISRAEVIQVNDEQAQSTI